MTEQITLLERCWYLSAPWGQEIPLFEVNLWERVYLKALRTFGYCSGFRWDRGQWVYLIELKNEIVQASKYGIITTGRMEPNTVEKPAYAIGDRVMLVNDAPFTKQRLVLGLQFVDSAWFYLVEWHSPMLDPNTSSFNSSSLVAEAELVRVMV
ncbi:DUF1392 family protein [Anabaena azotica]|uniref:DUF1392 family protein n=1 Tax=Anabaena azotica FACHB-119 TaxID=947527 RepID=A0ABR8DIE1_9NOST|nr:DUF1392 family protein [Anabaena azotica]MBD2505553.1 DUF1392 family protein [Anabaena azotica FACHB-119]